MPVALSVMVYVGFAALAVPLWQLAHLASRMGWMAMSQGTPRSCVPALASEPPDSAYAAADLRSGRAVTRLTAPVSTFCGMPGVSAAVLVRLSWQPPQKRCSPARPLIQ